MCGLRMLAAKNSRKRSEARSPAAAISIGTACDGASVMNLVWGTVAGSCSFIVSGRGWRIGSLQAQGARGGIACTQQ